METDNISNSLESIECKEKIFYNALKRFFDLFLSLIYIILLSLPMIFIGILIKIDSKGPSIFKQERLGKDGNVFIMYKFRSMYINAEDDGPKWADKDDKRCTKIGRFLRLTRLDELPQLFNILKGDMSFVGPRPERPCFYEEFEKYIPDFINRTLAKPGLTGLAQISGGYELKPEEKLVYDMKYIHNRSLLLDIKIFFKTIKFVFTHEGAR